MAVIRGMISYLDFAKSVIFIMSRLGFCANWACFSLSVGQGNKPNKLADPAVLNQAAKHNVETCRPA